MTVILAMPTDTGGIVLSSFRRVRTRVSPLTSAASAICYLRSVASSDAANTSP